MIGPWCVVSTFPTAVVLILTTLPGILQAKVHRCLREFEPSNCNALEQVWAFDAQRQTCNEAIYGGCGRSKHVSNRFETHQECMQNCGHIRANKGRLSGGSKADEKGTRSTVQPLGRIWEPDVSNNPSVNARIRNVLSSLETTIEEQPSPNVPRNQQVTFWQQVQQQQNPGQIYGQQVSLQPMHVQGQYTGPIFGNGQKPLQYGGQTYGGQPLGYVGLQSPQGSAAQPQQYAWLPQGYAAPQQGYGGQLFPGGLVQPSVYAGQVIRVPLYG